MPRPLRLAKSAHKRPRGERGRGEKTHQESFINSTGKFLRFSWRQTACVCVGLVCVSVCEVCLCVCVCWSMRHQFACIRNSFPLVIESLDKLSTAIGTYCLPPLSLSLYLPPHSTQHKHQPLCKLMSMLGVELPLTPLAPSGQLAVCWHQLDELICMHCGSKCIIRIPI